MLWNVLLSFAFELLEEIIGDKMLSMIFYSCLYGNILADNRYENNGIYFKGIRNCDGLAEVTYKLKSTVFASGNQDDFKSSYF